MKIFLLTLLLVAGGSQASFLSAIGDAFTTTFNQLLETGKEVGSSLLDELKVTGAQLASQSLQALMLNVGNALQATDAPATKRATAEEVVAPMRGLEAVVHTETMKLKKLLHGSMAALSGLAQQLTQPSTYTTTTLEQFLAKVDDVVGTHAKLSDAVVQGLVHEVTSLLPGNKRSLTDSLSAIGQSLSSIFQPHVSVLQSLVQSVGQVLKNAATQLFQNVMSSVTQLGTQLLGGEHTAAIQHESSAIAQSGQDAVSSLKEAVGDVLHQTMTDMQPHLTSIAGHLLSGLLSGKK